MSAASAITRAIDLLYVPPLSRWVSQRIFRYGICGALNMTLDAVWYFLIYHFIVCKKYVDLGFVVVSPHILSLAIVFPITFLTGFWLNRNVAFRAFGVSGRRQMARYVLTVAGSIALNYVCMKLLVEHAGVWATPAKAATTAICTVYSYLAGRYYTFSGR